MKDGKGARSHKPIIKRLQAAVLITLLASLAITYLITTFSYRDIIRDSLANRIESHATLLGNRSVAALIFNDSDAARANLAAASVLKDIVSICLFDRHGNLFADFISDQQAQRPDCPPEAVSNKTVSSTIFSGNRFILRQSIFDREIKVGEIQVTSSLSELTSFTRRSVHVTLGSLIIATLFALLLSRKLLERRLHPLQLLHQEIEKTTQSPFSYQPAELHTPYRDEISDLFAAYRTLLATMVSEHNALQLSEEQFRALAEHSPIGIYLKCGDSDYTFYNKKWLQINELEASDPPQSHLLKVHQDDKKAYLDAITSAANTGKTSIVEYRLVSANARPRVLLEYIAPMTIGQSFSGTVSSVLDISDQKYAQNRLEYLAFHDPLTSLPNRRLFTEQLESRVALASKTHGAITVAMIDLDNFKEVNDTFGHEVGDEVLSKISQRLRSTVFREDIVARMGGDEFIVLLENTKSIDRLQETLSNLIDSATKPFFIGSSKIFISLSAGVARFPEDSRDARSLINYADIALYQAKSNGRKRFEFFSIALDYKTREKSYVSARLREAIESGGFEIYLQPQYDIGKGSFSWSEALLRLRDENGEFISPTVFIPIAEEAGLIQEIDYWVVENVFKLFSSHRTGLVQKGIQGISINLSSLAFYSAGFINHLGALSDKYRVQPSEIGFELTESMVMKDVPVAIKTMHALRGLGYHISIDDFGTGYSSFSYLKQFNINYLKIDKSFIDGLPGDKDNASITETIITMANKLGLSVVAEGVENREQADFLQANGCNLIQGYYYARPQPVTEWLKP